MRFLSRLAGVFGAKTRARLERLEDPREALEAAYRRQLDALQETRRAVVDFLTGEKRLEIEAQALANVGRRHAAAAASAVATGDAERGRLESEREAFATLQREHLEREAAELRSERRVLEMLAERLRQRVELFRTEKLALGVSYAAATATNRAGETITGLAGDMAEVARTVERARGKARDAQARSAALTELAADAAASETYVEVQPLALPE